MQRLENESVVIRRLRPSDLEAVIALDSLEIGRRREEYFKVKLDQALAGTGIEISLAAEVDDRFVGFLLARVYYGEFGNPERVAVLDSLDVHGDFRGGGVGHALMRQLRTNLLGLHIRTLMTEVSWQAQKLITFFHREGFEPAKRLVLDLDLEAARAREETAG